MYCIQTYNCNSDNDIEVSHCCHQERGQEKYWLDSVTSTQQFDNLANPLCLTQCVCFSESFLSTVASGEIGMKSTFKSFGWRTNWLAGVWLLLALIRPHIQNVYIPNQRVLSCMFIINYNPFFHVSISGRENGPHWSRRRMWRKPMQWQLTGITLFPLSCRFRKILQATVSLVAGF